MLVPDPGHLLLKCECHSSGAQFVTSSSEDEHEGVPDGLVDDATMRTGNGPGDLEVGVEHHFHLLRGGAL